MSGRAAPAVAICVSVLAAAAIISRAGPLNPPAGPVASAYKTLTEVEPRIAVNAINTPGSGTCVFAINQPGSYYLTGNLAGVLGKNGIEIKSSGVTVDLRGFDVVGVPGSLDGIAVTATPLTNIAVTNGSVRGWSGDGIDFQTTLAFNTRITDVQADGNTGVGIKAGNAFVVERCSGRNNTGGGISCANQGIIRFCQTVSNIGTGIVVGQGSNISNCLSGFNFGGTADGIRTGGQCTISQCTATSGPGNGIVAGPASSITGCAVDGAALNGIQAANGSTIIGCSVNFCQNFNVQVGNGSTVADCSIQFASLGGIECAAQCVVRGNTCANNANGSATGFNIHATGADNRIEGNTCTQAGRGIDADVAGNIIIRNVCSGNSTNFDVAAGNVILVVSATTAPAVLGLSGGAAPGSTDPNANFSY